ncbi:MAG: PAS domain S-box protein, partial [Magnetococcales bacterium]|nr:PAS domain S-box protein [Magnetococcales bacterium]
MRVGSQDFEATLLTEDGKRLNVRVRAGVIRESVGGVPAGLAVFMSDLSDYKRTEAALRSSEARFRRAMIESPIPVMIYAEGGRISLLNRQWCELSGYNADELPTTWDWIRKASGGDPVRSESLTALFNARNCANTDREMVIATASGHERVWEVHARAVGALPDGRQEVISMAVDVTESKKVESALLRSRQEAESANRAKSAFLATMSHEIRTPMNAILGMAELICETRLTDEQKGQINVLRHSGEALLDLINDILDLSKVEAGQLEVDHVEFELDELLDTVVDIMGIRAMEKDLYLLTHIANGTPTRVWGDPARLRQILINLVGNAIKFTEEGEVSAHVVSRLDAAGRRLFRFSVSDTGIGIPPEKRESIFQAFTQADSSVTRKFGGTGLGLTICHRLVDLMGGRIQVESAIGRGSTFS